MQVYIHANVCTRVRLCLWTFYRGLCSWLPWCQEEREREVDCGSCELTGRESWFLRNKRDDAAGEFYNWYGR